MKIANIVVDPEKCDSPHVCKECLSICPTYVLCARPRKRAEKFRELEPKDYVVMGVNPVACTGCMDCVEACPTQAIQISFN